jgi:hypothetical protein
MTTDYRLLFTLPASNIAELKLGSQYLLLLQTQPGSTPPLTSTPAGPHDAQHRQDHGVVVGCGGVPAAEQIHSSEAVLSHEELRVKCPVRKTVRLQAYAAANGQVRCLKCTGQRLCGTRPWHCWWVLPRV